MPEKLELERQTPSQPRAQRTIADLFEATAQLLEIGAPERLTTNHVAARAGYSIGTLYRYFPSKLALLRAMASHEIRAQEVKVLSTIESLMPALDAERIIRIFVHAALHPFAGRHRVHAGVSRLLVAGAGPGAALDMQQGIVSQRIIAALSSAPSEVPLALSCETRFTMVHAVTGAIEAALRLQPELIASREFEDQLVGLVLHFLKADKRGA